MSSEQRQADVKAFILFILTVREDLSRPSSPELNLPSRSSESDGGCPLAASRSAETDSVSIISSRSSSRTYEHRDAAYRLVDVKPGGHPPQDGRVQVLWAVGGTHDDHLVGRELSEHAHLLLDVCMCGAMVTWQWWSVSSPSHRLMNWAFIMAVASWSELERLLRKESVKQRTGKDG